jgi:hypothetical protein
MRSEYKILTKSRKKDPVRDLYVDGRMILKWILGELGVKVWTGFISVRIGLSSILLCSEPSGS